MDLIRWLLEYVEQKATTEYSLPPKCNRYTLEQLHYHIGLCGEAGYFRRTTSLLEKRNLYDMKSAVSHGRDMRH